MCAFIIPTSWHVTDGPLTIITSVTDESRHWESNSDRWLGGRARYSLAICFIWWKKKKTGNKKAKGQAYINAIRKAKLKTKRKSHIKINSLQRSVISARASDFFRMLYEIGKLSFVFVGQSLDWKKMSVAYGCLYLYRYIYVGKAVNGSHADNS